MGSHRVTIGLGHTHLSKGKNSEDKTVWLSEPSWSLNYGYRIGDRGTIGLQTDGVLEKYMMDQVRLGNAQHRNVNGRFRHVMPMENW